MFFPMIPCFLNDDIPCLSNCLMSQVVPHAWCCTFCFWSPTKHFTGSFTCVSQVKMKLHFSKLQGGKWLCKLAEFIDNISVEQLLDSKCLSTHIHARFMLIHGCNQWWILNRTQPREVITGHVKRKEINLSFFLFHKQMPKNNIWQTSASQKNIEK